MSLEVLLDHERRITRVEGRLVDHDRRLSSHEARPTRDWSPPSASALREWLQVLVAALALGALLAGNLDWATLAKLL